MKLKDWDAIAFALVAERNDAPILEYPYYIIQISVDERDLLVLAG
ncbi:MAG: hypothetical protein ACYC3O_04390 [Burkholderiales bacterium]